MKTDESILDQFSDKFGQRLKHFR